MFWRLRFVFVNNEPAIKLYEKIGFRQVAVSPDQSLKILS